MTDGIAKELDTIRKLLEKSATKDSQEIFKAYKKALDETRKEIGLLYAKYSVDGVLDTTKATQAQLLGKIESFLKTQAQELGILDVAVTNQIVANTGKEAGLRTIYTLNKGLKVALSTNLVNPTAIKMAQERTIDGLRLSDRIWQNKAKLVNRVKVDVQKAIINGETIDKLSRRIRDDFNVSAYESKRLIHTEVAHMRTAIQEEIYSQTEVIERVMWLATLDDLTRDDHQDFDVQTWDKHENHPSPKDYISCRCTLVPIIEEWSPTKRKENNTKDTIDYTTYNKWQESIDQNNN